MDNETRQWYRELADAVIDAHEDIERAQRAFDKAEQALLTAMIDRELTSVYCRDCLLRLGLPEEGDAFLSLEPRPDLDLDL
jgi:hypothetical protein